jgi:hypothetical protein
MIVSVHQPQFLPWLGYFDKISRADVFVLLDNVQFKKNEWQNRNRIKTANGLQWLTVPVMYRYPQSIREVKINNADKWQHRIRQAVASNYKKARYWLLLEELFEEICSLKWEHISAINIHTVKRLAAILGIDTPVYVASELGELSDDPDERLIAVTKYFGGDTYLAGSGGLEYMDIEKYVQNGIKVFFQNYKHPVYNQLFCGFEPFASVVDLIFNHGNESLEILKGEK